MQYFPELNPSLPYITLAIAIISMWMPYRNITVPIFALSSIILAFLTNIIDMQGVLVITTLASCVCILAIGHNSLKSVAWWLMFILTSALVITMSMHILPGFNNLLIFKTLKISEDAIPYTLYWNFDKGIAGLALLIAIRGLKPAPIRNIWIITPAILAILILITFPIAIATGAVAWNPKLPDILLVWIFSNLLITCVAEEAFFRGLWQQTAANTLSKYTQHGPILAIILVSILFGLLHFPGGPVYIVLATIAGLAYGAAYHLTGRISAAIAVHFLFNLTHLLLFTYPLKAVA